MIAPLRFGSPAPGFEGGELEMTMNFYDLEAVEYKELMTDSPKKEEGTPWIFIILPIVALALFAVYILRKKQFFSFRPR